VRLAAIGPILMLLLSACSPVATLNALAPRDGVTVARDIAYAPQPRHALDIYAPAHAARPAPVIVFFYGGNWDSGSKAIYRFVGATLAARGVVTVIPDYRLYPQVKFPGFMQDAAAAFAWTRAHIASYGGDPHRMFVMGHSAGGQIAALLALDGSYLEADGASPRDICGAIGLAGPYDFLPLHSDELKDIFGPEPQRWRSQPINFVTPHAPPMLLLAGTADRTVDPGNTLRLAAKLRAAGVSVHDRLYTNVGHKALIGAMARPLGFIAPVRRAVLGFVRAHEACEAR
jgi:acetyl esterase/lipase